MFYVLQYGDTALTLASSEDSREIIKLLYEQGANVNHVNAVLTFPKIY